MSVPEPPVVNDGAVMRRTVVAQLESQDFSYARVHLEFACELSGSISDVSMQYAPNLNTAQECFFKHARGNLFVKILRILFD